MDEPTHALSATMRSIVPELEPTLARELESFMREVPRDGGLERVVDWIDDLVAWLRVPGQVALPATATISGRSAGARLWLLVRTLRAAPQQAELVRDAIGRVLTASSALSFFTDTGRPMAGGFFAEAARRLSRPLLPEAPELGQLAYVVGRLFDDEGAADWLDALPLPLVDEAVDMLTRTAPAGSSWGAVRAAMVDSIDVLSTRVASLGLAEDVRLRGSGLPVADSAFMRVAELGLWTAAQLRAEDEGEHPSMPPGEARQLLAEALTAADDEVFVVLEHLEEFGVSVDLVYRLEQLTAAVERLRLSLEVLIPTSGAARRAVALRLFSRLVREHLRDRSVTALLRASVRQLARKVIERAGETGEHYITGSRAEWHHMVRSAAGGGMLTAGTTVAKFLIAGLELPGLFLPGFAASLNYAVSFVVMQALGFTLATKQPSMTAATLAGAMGEARGARDYVALSEHIARTARSQLAAVLGNLGAVIPVALMIDVLWRLFTGAAFLSVDKAQYTIASLDPLSTGTIFYAALTGVLLWSSSMIAGSLENWAVYRRLPEAIAKHRRLRRWVGDATAARWGDLLAHNVSAVGGSAVLGFLLGMTAVIGGFFGLPLDVRHVTLSTGSLAFAVAALGPSAAVASGALAAVVGIAVIGLLNFGVSFALALMVALRAREVSRHDTVRVGMLVLRRFVRDPRPFFWPPRA